MEPVPIQPPPQRFLLREVCLRITDFTVTFLGLAAIIGILYLALGQAAGHDARGAVALQEYDAVAPVQCGSRSISLVVRCNDQLLLREVSQHQNLTSGHIYIYRAGNGIIVHRYVACEDHCRTIIMKGDNNRIAEKVNRTSIAYEVIGAYYDTT